MKTRCIVVVGHVDHGKTALVRALTGMETDRLPEEKARGVSIAAGFAYHTYPEGIVDFIDAPGHEDFIQAMIGAATGARGVLVVVSAVDTPQAQTFEHLAIAGLLGIDRGVIAVTKSDLIAPLQRGIRLGEIRAALSATVMADAPMILCSAHDGSGIAPLHAEIRKLLADHTVPEAPRGAVLPVDRVFSLAGQGTVVTGTLLGGDLFATDELTLQPKGHRAPVRSLQSRGVPRNCVHAGERVAVNLRGIQVDQVKRGTVLSARNIVAPSVCIDVRIDMLGTASKALRHMEKLRVHFGTSQENATVRLFGGGPLWPDQSGFAQLRFENPVVGFEGQRAVLRRLSPAETIGGAGFLDTQSMPARAGDLHRLNLLRAVDQRAPAEISGALCLTSGGAARVRDIVRLMRQDQDETLDALGNAFERVGSDLIARRADLEDVGEIITQAVAVYHAEFPLKMVAPLAVVAPADRSTALTAHVLDQLNQRGIIRLSATGIALQTHDPIASLTPDQQAVITHIDVTFASAALTAIPADTNPDLIALLVATGRLVSLYNFSLKQTLLLHVDALVKAAELLAAAFGCDPFTTSQAREALGTSRKIIVPLLEHFDKTGVTLRTGDARQATGAIPVSPPPPFC
jgi:selenocysteine-specific elongation factor